MEFEDGFDDEDDAFEDIDDDDEDDDDDHFDDVRAPRLTSKRSVG